MFSGDKTTTTASVCSWCLCPVGGGKIRCCGQCNNALYCSKDHQIQHWKVHRKVCRPNIVAQERVLPQTQNVTLPQASFSGWFSDNNNVPTMMQGGSSVSSVPETPFITAGPSISSIYKETPQDFEKPNPLSEEVLFETNSKVPYPPQGNDSLVNAWKYSQQTSVNDDLFGDFPSDLFSSSNDYWDLINNCSNDGFNFDSDFDMSSIRQDNKIIEDSVDKLDLISPSIMKDRCSSDDNEPETPCCGTVEAMSVNVIHDMNDYGICVIDNFLGSKLGNVILTEVKLMFLKGIFKRGELLNPAGPKMANQNIRGDVITWVNGTDPNCTHIGNLIKKLDIIMATCNKMPKNGILSKYKLNRRTKAMVACYPGDGTHYKKHIDNPHGDGRCITCIYYLNKNWDITKHGGLLRMFPTGNDENVANIEPLFDRMLFFWSDRRNPHEVLPSFDVRFAITVWYFDCDERDRALSGCGATKQK